MKSKMADINKTNAKRKRTLRSKMAVAAVNAVIPAAKVLCAPPSLNGIKRALFVQPHPDDNQIGAGGTMAWLVSRGVEVWELTVTDDRFAVPEYAGKENEVVTVRQQEAMAAQQLLGVKNAGFLGFADKTRASVDEISQAVLKVIREIKPDFVFTVDPNLATECHSDHIKVGQAVKFACMDSGCNFYPSFDNGELRKDAWSVKGVGFYYTDRANTTVDISDFDELKFQAMKCHKSQMDPALLAVVKLQQQLFAQGTPFTCAEKLFLMRDLHMHCFNLPVE